MESDYAFEYPLPRASGIPDVTFTCRITSPPPIGGMIKHVYASEGKTDNGEISASIEMMDEWYIFHFARSVDFYLSSDQIIAHLLDPEYHCMVELLLLGEVFSLWLELHGIRAIHASATVVNDATIAFLAINQGGKTGLAAAFTQRGHPLLTDDMLPIERRGDHFLARPGYPSVKMWPDEAEYFLGEYEDLDIVIPNCSKRRIVIGSHDFGMFCHEEKPLKVIYIPERLSSDSDIIIEPIPKKIAFFELLQNSFMAGFVEALGLQPERMNFFSNMVMQVPMRRLKYPDGFNQLSNVVDAVLEDIASLKE